MKQVELSDKAVKSIEIFKSCDYSKTVAEVAAKMVQNIDVEADGTISTQEGNNQLLAARWLFDFANLLKAIESKDNA